MTQDAGDRAIETLRTLGAARAAAAPLSLNPESLPDAHLFYSIGGEDAVLSFPHGAYDATTVQQAHTAGFSMCYSSDPMLMNTAIVRSPLIPLGRIHIPENEWTCDGQGIAEEKLATFLFFRPIEK